MCWFALFSVSFSGVRTLVTRYKLPTPDGKFILVDARQAGQMVQDAEGTRFEVPTLLELRRLETVEESPTSAAGGWNRLLGGLFVLGAVLALAGGWAAYHYYRSLDALPRDPVAEQIAAVAVENAVVAAATPGYVPLPEQRNFHEFPAEGLYAAWRSLRDISLEEMPPPRAERIEQRRGELTRNIAIGGLVAAVGIGLIVSACFASTGRRRG